MLKNFLLTVFLFKTYAGQVGRYKINNKFAFNFADDDKANWVIRNEDLIETVRQLIKLQKGESKQFDDIDSLANRRLRRCGEIVSQVALRPAMARFERMIKERMSLVSTKEKPTPSQMLNPQPLISSLNYLFPQ